jgi:hypothetical protein
VNRIAWARRGAPRASAALALLLLGCGARSSLDEGAGEHDASAPSDAGADASDGGGCEVAALGGLEPPPWATDECPSAGCPTGSVCVSVFGPFIHPQGCAPIPAPCGGEPTCACMGCVCGPKLGCSTISGQAGLACDTNLP